LWKIRSQEIIKPKGSGVNEENNGNNNIVLENFSIESNESTAINCGQFRNQSIKKPRGS
jgi:hypothetical protein